MIRRTFLTAFGMIGTIFAQKAIMKSDGQAIVCESDAIKCPLGHATCKVINAPIAIGNDSYQNPDVQQLTNYHLLRCDTCHVLFTRE